MDGDEIRLVIPASPDYARVARIAAGSLAVRLGFDYPAVEDLRIAVDEALVLLLDPAGSDGTVTVQLTVEEDRLVIELGAPPQTGRLDGERAEDALLARHRFAEIVGPTVDEVVAEPDRGTVRLVKRRP